jgi:hypothetical protein
MELPHSWSQDACQSTTAWDKGWHSSRAEDFHSQGEHGFACFHPQAIEDISVLAFWQPSCIKILPQAWNLIPLLVPPALTEVSPDRLWRSMMPFCHRAIRPLGPDQITMLQAGASAKAAMGLGRGLQLVIGMQGTTCWPSRSSRSSMHHHCMQCVIYPAHTAGSAWSGARPGSQTMWEQHSATITLQVSSGMTTPLKVSCLAFYTKSGSLGARVRGVSREPHCLGQICKPRDKGGVSRELYF